MSLREWVADKPLALAIHDAFFFGQTEDLDEDELSGLGFAEYLSKHWKSGGAAGAAQFKEQLGDDGYVSSFLVLCTASESHLFLAVISRYHAHMVHIGKLGQAALRKKFKTVDAYLAHFSSMGKASQARLKEKLGSEEAYHENRVAFGKHSQAERRRKLGPEGYSANQAAIGKLGTAGHKKKLGEEAFHENRVAAGKAGIASRRQKLGEEEYRKRLSKQVTKSQPDLSVAHRPGTSDANDYKVFNSLNSRFRYWKKVKGVESEELKALMDQYREGYNNVRRRKNA
ncbi:MAG: hypothetical protein SGILL_010115 [Bacillariaceae sp.]